MSGAGWTGGTANRRYRSGTAAGPAVDRGEIAAQVRAYLADCEAFGLAAAEDTAARVVFGPAAVVREMYRRVMAFGTGGGRVSRETPEGRS